MNLFFTDSEFVWEGLSRSGIPFLCDAKMELLDAPNKYLRYVATVRGRTRAPNTWRTYGNHLYEYFSFVEVNELDWRRPTASQLSAWRDSMLERGCSRATANQRIRGVHKFYEWTTEQGTTQLNPFEKGDVHIRKDRGLLSHVDASGNRAAALDLTLNTNKTFPKFLLLREAVSFLDAATPFTVKLMGYIALLTGMRREEITALDYRVLPNPCGRDPSKHLQMFLNARLTPTKGNKSRIVMLPYDLAVAIWDYFNQIWPARSRKFKLRHPGVETTKLFLTSQGMPLSTRYLNNSFQKLSAKNGVICHPHMLRHTFGTYELVRVSRKFGEVKGLMWVRDRLGHTSIGTTELYVHGADLIKNDAVDGYQTEILNSMQNGVKNKND